jgi:glycopeptide antibiotics resistance protein
MANQTSQHILNTSANLLGFCLFVITSIHSNSMADKTLIDEFTSVVALMLSVSCFFSFLSIKTKNEKKELKLENIADYLFIFSIVGILFILVFMILEYSKF